MQNLLKVRLRPMAVTALVVLLGGASVPAVFAAQPGVVDVSASAQGQSYAETAAARFRSRGVDIPADSLRIVLLGDGSVLAMPSQFDANDIQIMPDGSTRISVSAASFDESWAPDRLAPGLDGDATVAAAPIWSQKASHCFARWYAKTPSGTVTGWMDTCYRINKLIETSDGTYDHWEITAYATADATRANWKGDYAWIHVDRDGGPTFYWEDWDPRSDLSGNCGARSLSVAALGVGIGFGTTVCETWSLTKYAAAGELKVQWNGDSAGAREVALMSGIKVANGASSPIWGISWYFKTYCGVSRYC